MIRWYGIVNRRFASTQFKNTSPRTVKSFFSKPGHEVTTFLNNLTEEEQNTKIGPNEVNDILIYYKLLQDTDHPNLDLSLIMQFENRMLGISNNQLSNSMIMNDTFEKLLNRKLYFKYLLLLKRLPTEKQKTVHVNKLLSHYIKDLNDYDAAVAFRFSSRNLSFATTAEFMDKLISNASRITSSNYTNAFVNSLYEMLWRSLSVSLYEVDHELSPKAKKIIKECYEKTLETENKPSEVFDDDDFEDGDTYIDEATGKLEYHFNGRDMKKKYSQQEIFSLTIQRMYVENLSTVLNDTEFFEYTHMILQSQAVIDEGSLLQIISTLKNKIFLKMTDPKTKQELMNTLYFIFADCVDPLNDKVNLELKAIKELIIKNDPEFQNCKSMKVFYNAIKNSETKYYWSANLIEHFNVLLTASVETHGLYMYMKEYILSNEFLKYNKHNKFVFNKWLADLSYLYEHNPGVVNTMRMKHLSEDFIDALITDKTSLLNTYDFYLRTWFVYGYKKGFVDEASLMKSMKNLSEIFISHMNKLNIKDEQLSETILKKYEDAFTALTRKYPHHKTVFHKVENELITKSGEPV
ncbi:hypothetical protein FOG48_03639 [Hanseniaspora uvarum]|nr:hypothetical protein FOG48_03639 [Hanseniaspora uvarum]